MSKRVDVLLALIACIGRVRTGLNVIGLVGDEAVPGRLATRGQVVIGSGNPGEPEVDLSPAFYWYNHVIPIAVALPVAPGQATEQALADLLGEIEAAVLTDPTLALLCEHLEFTAPETTDIAGNAPGSVAVGRVADLDLLAFYGSPSPLS